MADYFLQDDGETLLDSNGMKIGTVTDFASKGLFVKPLSAGAGLDLTTNDIPPATPQGVFTRTGNALSSAVQGFAPELQPYQSVPPQQPQSWDQALAPNQSAPEELGLAGRVFNRTMGGAPGSQDVFSRAMNRVAGDIMAYDGFLEKDNELSPKRVVNALTGSLAGMGSKIMPYVEQAVPPGIFPTLDLALDYRRKKTEQATPRPGIDPLAQELTGPQAGSWMSDAQNFFLGQGMGGIQSEDRARADIALEARNAGLSVEEYKDILTEGMGTGRHIRPVGEVATGLKQTAKSFIEGGDWLLDSQFLRDLSAAIGNDIAAASPDDPNLVDEVARGVGSSLAFLPLGVAAGGAASIRGMAPRIAKAIGVSVPTILESFSEAGSARRDMLDKGAPMDAANMAATKSFWANIPVIAVTEYLGGLYDTHSTAPIWKRAASAAFAEGPQEGLQDRIGSWAKGELPDPVAEAKSTAVGGLTGAISGVGVSSLQGSAQAHPYADIIQAEAARIGVDPGYLTKVMMAESGGKADAKAATSSASGLFQFTDGTWAGLVKQYGAQYGLTPEGRNDPIQQAVAAAIFTRDNRDFLAKTLGREPSEGELYMAAFLGQGGARQFLTGLAQDPNAKAISYASPEAVKANRSIFFDKETKQPRTAQEVYDLMAAKVGGQAAGVSSLQALTQEGTTPEQTPPLPTEEPTQAARPWDTTIPAEEEADPYADTAVTQGQQRADMSTAPAADEWTGHTVEDVKRMFPVGRITETEDGHRVDFPNGQTLVLNRVGRIDIDEDVARASGYTDEQIARAKAGAGALGQFLGLRSDGAGLIELTPGGRTEIGHEVGHFLREHLLTPQQNSVLDRAYMAQAQAQIQAAAKGQRVDPKRTLEEVVVKALNSYWNGRGPDKTGVFAAIKRILSGLRQYFAPTAEGVFEKIARGDVWKQTPQGAQSQQNVGRPAQQPAARPRPANYTDAVYDGFSPDTHASKMVRVEGVNQETGERGSGMMRAADAMDSAAATIEDYKRLLDCL